MPDAVEYLCPGDNQPIDRAIHQARMASHYAACRDCPHRDDTGLLPRATIKRIETARRSAADAPRFHEEGVEGVYHNQISLASARQLGAAFGSRLLQDGTPADHERPRVVLAGDGRALTAEFLAAAAEGLRYAGCDVLEAAAATSGSLTFAMHHTHSDGGLLLGNRADRPHVLGIKFWSLQPLSLRERCRVQRGGEGRSGPQVSAISSTPPEPTHTGTSPHPACGHLLPEGEGFSITPWSAGPQLDKLRAALGRPIVRQTRTAGTAARCTLEGEYLASLADYFHALRPLRIVLRTSSSAFRAHLAQLAANVACTILDEPVDQRGLSAAVMTSDAHFGLWVDGDGEAMRLVDEAGREVGGDRLLLVFARHLLAERPAAAIVVEADCRREVIVALHEAGAAVHRSTALRAEMTATMSQCRAVIGGGPSGRCWLPTPSPAPDALHALALLLRILSQRDWPLSEVVTRSLEPAGIAS